MAWPSNDTPEKAMVQLDGDAVTETLILRLSGGPGQASNASFRRLNPRANSNYLNVKEGLRGYRKVRFLALNNIRE